MKASYTYIALILVFTLLMTQGCIHEYPLPVSQGHSNKPTDLQAFISVNFDISWQSLIHEIDFSSRDRNDEPNHFIIEISDQTGKVCHDEVFLSNSYFFVGSLQHKVSTPLAKQKYEIAVWYEKADEEGEYSFLSTDLSDIAINNFSTTDASLFDCAYASTTLDLTDFNNQNSAVNIELEMLPPGARFELIATDVNQFISDHKEDLNEGDSYSVKLNFSDEAYFRFNSYNGNPFNLSSVYTTTGRMRLPFAEYEELKIAEGFIFCHPESEAHMQLSILNSSQTIVSQTNTFSFPIKRGFNTIVKAEFLTHPLDGVFNVDFVWEEDIIIEI